MQATPAGVISVGSNLVYTVTLTNTTATATNVQLVDTLPPAVDFIGAAFPMRLARISARPLLPMAP